MHRFHHGSTDRFPVRGGYGRALTRFRRCRTERLRSECRFRTIQFLLLRSRPRAFLRSTYRYDILAKMEHRFQAGDFLFYQLESGFALIRLLEVEDSAEDAIWHLSAFHDLFPDVETIEKAVSMPDSLSVSIPHVALTNRAFESTQVAG